MNPFIAISSAFLTFLAFYIQFKANRQQQAMFVEELKEQRSQFSKSQFDNQFYEMLRLHKENVNEIEVIQSSIIQKTGGYKEKVDEKISGRNAMSILLTELEIALHVAKDCFPDTKPKVWVNEPMGYSFTV